MTTQETATVEVTQASKAAIARGAPIIIAKDDYAMAERVIENWCVKGDKRKTRQLIAEGIALARDEARIAAALLRDANSHYSAGQIEEIERCHRTRATRQDGLREADHFRDLVYAAVEPARQWYAKNGQPNDIAVYLINNMIADLRVYHSPAHSRPNATAMAKVDEEELIDLIDDAISDSFDEEWNSRMGARHIVGALEHEGWTVVRAALSDRSTREEIGADTNAGDVLREAAQELLDGLSSTYKARNGREVGIEADDGEKCYIVHSDLVTGLRAALSASPEGEG